MKSGAGRAGRAGRAGGAGRVAAAVFALVIAALVPAFAQTAGAPRPALPRASDGKPDLSGVWEALSTANDDLQDHAARLGAPAGQGVVEGNEIPYKPGAIAKKQENARNRETADPESKCFLLGVPRTMYAPFPFQIVYSPAYMAIFSEYAHTTRSVFMNSEHPKGPIEWFMGDSRGRWEGDTLVVDVRHFTDLTWFDRAGNYHSADLHVVERYSLVTPDHIQYEATIEDPNVYARPWKISLVLYRRKEPNVRVLEYECYAYAQEEQVRRGELGPK
jgi:hypothetical protein